MTDMNVFRMPEWYSKIASDCFPTVFVEMNAAVLDALKAGRQEEDPAVKEFLPKLEHAMDKFPSLRFLSVDTAAPTDTERFLIKRGAVHSAKSAWRILCSSVKVRRAADAGLVTCICVRPFRRMQPAREFRLFIKDGKLAGMSQYWLIRHFRRLPERREKYWKRACALVERLAPQLPVRDLAMDIYFKSSGEILIVDLNPWGEPTEPLMYNTWDRDWNEPGDCRIVPPPHKVSGEVNVHF